MLTIRTRSSAKHYDTFFGTGNLGFSEFKGLYNEGTPLKIAVEINGSSWKAFFGKLSSSRKSAMGQSIFVEIAGKGERGDKDSSSFFNMVSYILQGGILCEEILENVGKSFDKIFDQHFIDSLDEKRQTAEAQMEIQKRMDLFSKNFPMANVSPIMDASEEGSCNVALLDTSVTKSEFLSRLSFMVSKSSLPVEKLVLVCTFSPVSKENFDSFLMRIGNNAAVRILVKNRPSWLEKLPWQRKNSPNISDIKKKFSPAYMISALMFVSLFLNLVFLLRINSLRSENSLIKNQIQEEVNKNSELLAEKSNIEQKLADYESDVGEDVSVKIEFKGQSYNFSGKARPEKDGSEFKVNGKFVITADKDSVSSSAENFVSKDSH